MSVDSYIEKFKGTLSSEKIFNHIVNIYTNDRWSSFDKYHKTLLYCKSVMKEIGLEDIEVFSTPADGKTRLDDMIMPLAWDCHGGTIKISYPSSHKDIMLADYKAIPNSIIRWSVPVKNQEYKLVFMEDGTHQEDYKDVDVKGKVIFTNKNAVYIKKLAAQNGAIGILSDFTSGPRLETPNTVQWKNVWHDGGAWGTTENDSRLFGASLSPIKGERLKKILKQNKEVRIVVNIDSCLYRGKIEGITGVIKGKTCKEILLTPHMYECGADDNASGVAAFLEIARELNERIKKGQLQRPYRTIRLIFGWEYISFLQFVHKYPQIIKNSIAGVCLDAVAFRQDMTKTDFAITTNPPESMCIMDPLLVEMFKKYAQKDAYLGFSFKKHGTTGGCGTDYWYTFPNINIPMVYPNQNPGNLWHSNLDTPENIDKNMLVKVSEIVASYVCFISSAGKEELAYALDLTEQQAFYEIKDLYHQFRHKILANPIEKNYWQEIFEARLRQKEKYFSRAVDNARRFDKGLSSTLLNTIKDNIAKLTQQEKTRIGTLCQGIKQEKWIPGTPKLQCLRNYSNIVPIYLEKTPPFFWNRFKKDHKTKKVEGALFYIDGKNTIRDIIEGLMDEKDMDRYPNEIADFIKNLEKVGYVKLKHTKHFTQKDLVKDLVQCDIKKGDVVLVHSSLTNIGYVEGGAETVIRAFMEILTDRGTLVMPTFSHNASYSKNLKEKYYDPSKTHSQTGIISDVFWKMPGVLRNNQPTHSLSAWGKHAEYIIKTNKTMEPYVREGSFGRLYDVNARIVMLGCGLAPNSTLHAVEEWAGIPTLKDCETYYNDEMGKPVTVITMQPIYDRDFYWSNRRITKSEALFRKKGIIKDCNVGLADVHIINYRDIVNEGLKALRSDPVLFHCDNPECKDCPRIKKEIFKMQAEIVEKIDNHLKINAKMRKKRIFLSTDLLKCL